MAKMSNYKVTLDIPGVGLKVIEVSDDTYIQEAAVGAGIELPYDCGAGSCSTCAARLVSGKVEQSDQSYLDDEQIKEGLILLCVSYARSDCLIKTHQEKDVYRS
jgi:ferredoxin